MPGDSARASKFTTAASEVVWLLGQPHLSDYLEFVKENVAGGSGMSPRLLADEWRAANEVYYDLEESEAGIVDEIEAEVLGHVRMPGLAPGAAYALRDAAIISPRLFLAGEFGPCAVVGGLGGDGEGGLIGRRLGCECAFMRDVVLCHGAL
jgi:hypothetical protein